MELRNGSVVGGSPGQMPLHLRPSFEQGVKLVLHRWTALCLAVENEWGGRDSRQKADHLYEDVLAWFYDNKEHYADDLEVDLEGIMVTDFNTEAEDDSPREISKELVALHNELITGQSSTFQRLQVSAPAAVNASTQQQTASEGSGDNSSNSGDEGDGDGEAMELDVAPQAVPILPDVPKGPIVDDDGFQLVQGRRHGR